MKRPFNVFLYKPSPQLFWIKKNKTKQRNIHREISRLNGNIAYLQHCVSFRGTAK